MRKWILSLCCLVGMGALCSAQEIFSDVWEVNQTPTSYEEALMLVVPVILVAEPPAMDETMRATVWLEQEMHISPEMIRENPEMREGLQMVGFGLCMLWESMAILHRQYGGRVCYLNMAESTGEQIDVSLPIPVGAVVRRVEEAERCGLITFESEGCRRTVYRCLHNFPDKGAQNFSYVPAPPWEQVSRLRHRDAA